jgi:hypothetical protein
MNTTPFKFCIKCGAPRHGGAGFCGACGSSFPASGGQTASAIPPNPGKPCEPAAVAAGGSVGNWQVIAGEALPPASGLFDLSRPARPVRQESRKTASSVPASKNKPLWGNTFWMSITQAADMVTRSLETGGPGDPYLSLRLGVAAAVAIFGLALAPLPRLRSVLVRLGTIAMAVMQGQGLLPVVQSTLADPSLIGTFAPNLAAHAAGLTALLQLFRAARFRAK